MWYGIGMPARRPERDGLQRAVWYLSGLCRGKCNQALREPDERPINPRNAPYVFGIRSAATSIATGNTAILKGSELTPCCYWAVGKAFHEAGLAAGVLNVLSCPPSKAEEILNVMIEHPAVRHINFTGSATMGRKAAKTCGQNLKPCLMELGGKYSAVVLKDGDLQKAAGACIAGSFFCVRLPARLWCRMN
jgi:acyl-CoA reductase-like NAD-dependent aldehyde dehydrogenase